jgi:hypothetical protein
MKDNTIVYVGVGLLAVYLLMQKKSALPAGTVTVGPVNALPINQQQGLLLPFFNKVVSSLGPVVSNLTANNPVSTQGLNFTPIANQTPTDASNLTATDATGTTYYGQGVTYDPNAFDSGLPTDLPLPDLTSNAPIGYVHTDED